MRTLDIQEYNHISASRLTRICDCGDDALLVYEALKY